MRQAPPPIGMLQLLAPKHTFRRKGFEPMRTTRKVRNKEEDAQFLNTLSSLFVSTANMDPMDFILETSLLRAHGKTKHGRGRKGFNPSHQCVRKSFLFYEYSRFVVRLLSQHESCVWPVQSLDSIKQSCRSS